MAEHRHKRVAEPPRNPSKLAVELAKRASEYELEAEQLRRDAEAAAVAAMSCREWAECLAARGGNSGLDSGR
jgi:hypothetical protein